ncbi:MAG TPA: 2-C-methyl-D-erythritol 2,4-cyclodiphosphate synthase [Acidimicrobiales bacterium]|jgi:2-C-methyl-D-erythritol 2,4-cyclodiphosphate synthase
MRIRVGQGFDVHRFSDDTNRPLVLGGVLFPGERGLEGHSDADAVAHAAADALLGAAGLGDLGQHFPDTDPVWAGTDSLRILAAVAAMVRAAGWEVGNVDVSVVCEAPTLAPHRAGMEANLSAAAGAPVTVKGRRAEGLGALGRREGIACWAVAVITGA